MWKTATASRPVWFVSPGVTSGEMMLAGQLFYDFSTKKLNPEVIPMDHPWAVCWSTLAWTGNGPWTWLPPWWKNLPEAPRHLPPPLCLPGNPGKRRLNGPFRRNPAN